MSTLAQDLKVWKKTKQWMKRFREVMPEEEVYKRLKIEEDEESAWSRDGVTMEWPALALWKSPGDS